MKSLETLRVRVIHYEIIPAAEAHGLGMPNTTLSRLLDFPGEIAVLRCTTDQERRVTVVCSEGRMRELLASGLAKDPKGMVVTKREFPVAWKGWGNNPTKPESMRGRG